jgi:hypothetical protein
MTSTSWTNQAYYGLKLKKDFSLLDTLLKKYRGVDLDDLQIDTMLKMMKHKATVAMNITTMMEKMDTANRLENMEALIRAVTPEALAEAKKIIGT